MTDKVCDCQFCKDYKRFKVVLPLLPVEHQEWFESIFDSLWNAQEELSYKKAILDGSWPESIVTLEHALFNAKKRLAKEETPLNFDCKVCDKCSKAMTAKEYWNHDCKPEHLFEHACDVVDISDGPCGDPSHDEPKAEKCPNCSNGYLVERTNHKTKNTFFGCNEWPACEFTKSGGSNPAQQYERVGNGYEYEDEDDNYLDEDFFMMD